MRYVWICIYGMYVTVMCMQKLKPWTFHRQHRFYGHNHIWSIYFGICEHETYYVCHWSTSRRVANYFGIKAIFFFITTNLFFFAKDNYNSQPKIERTSKISSFDFLLCYRWHVKWRIILGDNLETFGMFGIGVEIWTPFECDGMQECLIDSTYTQSFSQPTTIDT